MKNIKYFIVIFLACAFMVQGVSAYTSAPKVTLVDTNEVEVIKAFQKYEDVRTPDDVVVPTVLEVPFDGENFGKQVFAIKDKTTNTFEPYLFKRKTYIRKSPVDVSASGSVSSVRNIFDGNSLTYAEFPVDGVSSAEASINLNMPQPVTLSSMYFIFGEYVSIPNSVEIKTSDNGVEKVVVAKRSMSSNSAYFPRTTASHWIVSFTYTQPLRIAEIQLNEENVKTESFDSVRFLGQPNHSYRIYFDADRYVSVRTKESGDLSSDFGVIKIQPNRSEINPAYVVVDTDGDGIADGRDNCPSVSNGDQKDIDRNGIGDACDDFDRDGILNIHDNCPNLPNVNQADADNDNIGDVCDGEESRITERLPWLPWAGMGFALLTLIVLIVLAVNGPVNLIKEEDKK